MSSRTKGAYYENKVADELRAAGALVEKARAKVVHLPNGQVFSISCDLFGLFDGIAILSGNTMNCGWDVFGRHLNWRYIPAVLFYQVKFLGEKNEKGTPHVNESVREGIRAFPAEHKALIIFRKKGNKVERECEWL